MNPLARQLAELKYALQELESAVQQPRDERFGIEQVLDRFPTVLTLFYHVLRDAIYAQGGIVNSPLEAFAEAHRRGWLRGDLALWLRLVSDFDTVTAVAYAEGSARAIAQDVRASSWMLWETYEVLTARFRWQTQVQSIAKPTGSVTLPKFTALPVQA